MVRVVIRMSTYQSNQSLGKVNSIQKALNVHALKIKLNVSLIVTVIQTFVIIDRCL